MLLNQHSSVSLQFRPHGQRTYVYYEYYRNGRKETEYLGRRGNLDEQKVRKCLNDFAPTFESSLSAYIELVGGLPEDERTRYMNRLLDMLGVKGEIIRRPPGKEPQITKERQLQQG